MSVGHQATKIWQSEWLCAACDGKYGRPEANRVLKIQASCRPEDTRVLRAHAPHSGSMRQHDHRHEACGELAQGRGTSSRWLCEGIKESRKRKVGAAAPRPFIELDNLQVLVSVSAVW